MILKNRKLRDGNFRSASKGSFQNTTRFYIKRVESTIEDAIEHQTGHEQYDKGAISRKCVQSDRLKQFRHQGWKLTNG